MHSEAPSVYSTDLAFKVIDFHGKGLILQVRSYGYEKNQKFPNGDTIVKYVSQPDIR